MWLPDPKTGEKSVTVTLTVAAFILAMIRYSLSGLQFGSFLMPVTPATDVMIILSPLLTAYLGRKYTDKDK